MIVHLFKRLFNAHIAHESGRGFVFPDYWWEPTHYPFTFTEEEKKHYYWPPLTPLNALLSGPVAGGPWEATDDTPRSINQEFFDSICPRHERRFLNTSDVKHGLGGAEASAVLEAWSTKLRELPDRCVEVVGSPDDSFPQSFDLWIVTSPRMLSLWDSFSKSPVSTLLRPSHIVSAAVERNLFLFSPRGPRPGASSGASTEIWDRVLAMHLRRGDYESHCKHLANYDSIFYAWNLLPFLPDPLKSPPSGTSKEEMYAQRCFPDVDAIVRKARQAKREHNGYVDVLYILTNEKGHWLDALLKGLKADGWATARRVGRWYWIPSSRKRWRWLLIWILRGAQPFSWVTAGPRLLAI